MNILVIGRNEEIQQTIVRLLNSQPDWKATGATSDAEAIRLFAEQTFDIVLFGGGVEENSEIKLTGIFKDKSPSIKIIRHYGGGSGLLFGEIFQAINTKQ